MKIYLICSRKKPHNKHHAINTDSVTIYSVLSVEVVLLDSYL